MSNVCWAMCFFTHLNILVQQLTVQTRSSTGYPMLLYGSAIQNLPQNYGIISPVTVTFVCVYCLFTIHKQTDHAKWWAVWLKIICGVIAETIRKTETSSWYLQSLHKPPLNMNLPVIPRSRLTWYGISGPHSTISAALLTIRSVALTNFRSCSSPPSKRLNLHTRLRKQGNPQTTACVTHYIFI